MKRIYTLLLVIFLSNVSFAADFFWISGSGDWNDPVHWSLTSGGAPGVTLPTANDNAIFDDNSGLLSIGDTVNVNVPVTVHDFDFSGVSNILTFESLAAVIIEIQGSLSGNLSGVNFAGVWGEIKMNALVLGETISSQGTIWVQDFRVSGEQIALLDGFDNGLNSFFVDLGGIDFAGFSFTSFEFHSNVATLRTINIANSTLNILGGFWAVDSVNLTWTSGASEMLLGDNATLAEFNGGGLPYDTLRSQTALELSYFKHNQFDLFEVVPSSQLKMTAGDSLSTDSLIVDGTCPLPTQIFSLTPGILSYVIKTGYPDYVGAFLSLTDVDAGALGTYGLVKSDTTNSLGWTDIANNNFYWVGDAGNWTDGNHWSFTSGGLPSGCVPTQTDSVFFDALSFTLTGQNVFTDDFAHYKSMDWTGIFGDQSLLLDSNMFSYGDIVFHPNLTLVRNTEGSSITFYEQAELYPNAATIDCSFNVFMTDPTDSMLIMNDLLASDSSAIVLLNGEVYTLDNTVSLGTIVSINNPFIGSDVRKIDFGNSIIELKVAFDAAQDTVLTFLSGNSHLFIGDTLGYANDLLSLGLNFYDVTLNYQLVDRQQLIKGSNTFHDLTVLSGSVVHLEDNSTQTVSDSLILLGNCLGRIYIGAQDTLTANQASIAKLTTTTDYIGENLVLERVIASGQPLTTLFSTDLGGNTNWTFDAAAPVVADYTFGGSFCYGDTVIFTNNSTVYLGGAPAMSSIWYFNDGSTGYYLNPPTDSTFIIYEPDTTLHSFLDGGDFNVAMITTNLLNFCTDTSTQIIHINRAEIFMTTTETDTTICAGDEVVFEASSFTPGATFEYFVNGVSQNTPSVNDSLFTTTSLVDLDFVSAVAYENGCVSDSMPSYQYVVNPLPIYNFVTSDLDSTICYTDSVSFSAFQPVEPTYDYQFLINGIGVTAYIDSFNYYVNDSLIHNDTILSVGRNVFGCSDTLSMIYSVNDLPTTSLSSSVAGNVICDGDLVTFTAIGADNYEFFVNGNSVQGPSATDTYSTTALVATDTVTANGINLASCEFMAPEFYYYIVSPVPTTTMTLSDADSSICSGDVVTFTASGAPLYEFFVNGVSAQFGAQSEYLTDSLNHNDLVEVYGQIGACTSPSGSVLMEVLTSPTTNLVNNDDGDNTVCYGTPVTFTGTGATNYEFFVDNVSVQGPSALSTYSTAGLLNGQVVRLDGESNTCIRSEEDIFTVLTNPIVSFFSNDLDNTICDGESIEFIAANAGTFEFVVNGASAQGPSPITALNNPAMNIGVNPVFVVGIAGNGCKDTSAIINITVNPIPVVGLTSSDADDIICAGDEVIFTGTGSDMYQFFIGSTAQGALSPTSSFNTTALANGESVSVFGSSLGCTSTSNVITMTVNAIPGVSISSTDVNNTYCTNELVDYTMNGATNYEFFVGGVSQGPPSVTNTINSSGFPSGAFVFSVAGETNACFDTAQVSILINTTPTASIVSSDLDNTICDGDVVTYTGTGGALYQYFLNGVTQGPNSPTSTFTLNSLLPSDQVSVTVSTAQGCTDVATMAAITVNPNPTVLLTSSEPSQAICIGENVDFTATGATDYEFFVDGISQGASSPTSVLSTANLVNGNTIYAIGTSLSCPSTSNTFAFTVYNYPVVSFVNNGDSVLCVLEASDLSSSGADNYQFLVNGLPIGTSGPTNMFSNSLINGDVVSVIGETNGCSSLSNDDFTFIIYDYPILTSTSSSGPTICLNDQVDFTASGALSYVYELNGAEIQSGVTSTFGLNTTEDGDQVTIVGYNEECASGIDSYIFIVNSMDLALDISASNMICEGEPVVVTGSGADQYEFFLNSVSQGPISATNTFTSSTLNDLDEITYVAFSSATGCTQPYSSFAIMNVIDEPLVSPVSSLQFCDGDSVVLLSNALYGNQWYLDGFPILDATDTSYTAFISGDYSLQTTSGGLNDLWSFGLNANGTFGNGTNFNNSEPTVSTTTQLFDEISSGDNFVLAVNTAGEVYSWGENLSGQLGDGTYTSTNEAAQVPTLTNIKTVSTAARSSMAVSNTGDVYVWGINTNGQLGTGNTSVINFPFLNTGITNVDSIAGGKQHFVILKNDGTVWTVGNNDQGQLGQGDLTPLFSAIQVSGLANVVSVGASEYSSYAITGTGELMVWGNNGSGQLGLNDLNNRLSPAISPLKKVRSVQGGANHTVFLTTKDEVFTAGGNTFGQLGTSDFFPRLVPTKISISGAKSISAGQYTSLILREDKSVFGCGNNVEDQLSLSLGFINSPEQITDLDGVEFIDAGRLTSHVIYNETKECASVSVDVDVLVVPAVIITATGATLSTIAAASYQWYFNWSIIPGAVNQSYTANETGDFSVQVVFANGCSAGSDSFPMSFVSLDDLDLIAISVYPNPTTDVLNLEVADALSGELTLRIYDHAGRIVLEEARTITGATQLDISQLEMGMYHLTVEDSGRVANVRFVKSVN